MCKRDLGVEHVVTKLKRWNQVWHPALVMSVKVLLRLLIVDASLDWGDPRSLII